MESVWQKFISKGSEKAFTELYQYYVKRLYSFGIGFGFSEDTCKDAIQDVFYKIYRHRMHLNEVGDHKSYIFTCFKNRLYDIMKSRKKQVQVPINEIPFYINVTVLDNLVSDEEKTFLRERINYFLSLLSDRQREAIYLHFIEELDYKQIAGMMNAKVESVRTMVYRGLKIIKLNTNKAALSLLMFIHLPF